MEDNLTYIMDMLDLLNNDDTCGYSKDYINAVNEAYEKIEELEKLVNCDKAEGNVNLLYLMVDSLAHSLFMTTMFKENQEESE